jgi:anthranilate synthase/aminodeoxychorismate synthase-like glutamine amidotransferase
VILVIDNYDSFTFNLVQALQAAGATVCVVRNDGLGPEELERLGDGPAGLSGILISPGPGDPDDAGISLAAVGFAAERRLPLLGVCLGHQCLGAAFGASIVRAPSLVHGEASEVSHRGEGLLAGLPSPFPAARYHSLCVDEVTLPVDLEVTARADDGVVMAMRHRTLPLEGVQFHPESVLTPAGPRLLANFLRLVGEGSPGAMEAAGDPFAGRRPQARAFAGPSEDVVRAGVAEADPAFPAVLPAVGAGAPSPEARR